MQLFIQCNRYFFFVWDISGYKLNNSSHNHYAQSSISSFLEIVIITVCHTPAHAHAPAHIHGIRHNLFSTISAWKEDMLLIREWDWSSQVIFWQLTLTQRHSYIVRIWEDNQRSIAFYKAQHSTSGDTSIYQTCISYMTTTTFCLLVDVGLNNACREFLYLHIATLIFKELTTLSLIDIIIILLKCMPCCSGFFAETAAKFGLKYASQLYSYLTSCRS